MNALTSNQGIDNKRNLFDTLLELSITIASIAETNRLLLYLGTSRSITLVHNLDSDHVSNRKIALDITRDRYLDLDRYLDRYRHYARDLTRYLNLARDRTLVHEFDRYLDLDLDLALDITRALDLDLDRYLNLARELDLDIAHDLARALELDLEHYLNRTSNVHVVNIIDDFSSISQIIFSLINFVSLSRETISELQFCYQSRLALIYDEIEHLTRQEPSPVLNVIAEVIWGEMQENPMLITLEKPSHSESDTKTPEIITTSMLTHEISPYLQALHDIQEVYDTLKGNEFKEPKIIQIHNELPKISLEGLANAIQTVDNVFTPNRRRQETKKRELENERQELENKQLEETIQRQNKEQAIEAIQDAEKRKIEREKWQLEKERLQLENRKILLELEQNEEAFRMERLENAMTKLKLFYELWQIAPEMREDTAPHVAKLLRAIMQLEDIPRNLRIGWHDEPRPNSLPEQPTNED
ncbi:MAG: hypothetical protein AAFV93_02455 [Chloroflexota bacterium]